MTSLCSTLLYWCTIVVPQYLFVTWNYQICVIIVSYWAMTVTNCANHLPYYVIQMTNHHQSIPLSHDNDCLNRFVIAVTKNMTKATYKRQHLIWQLAYRFMEWANSHYGRMFGNKQAKMTQDQYLGSICFNNNHEEEIEIHLFHKGMNFWNLKAYLHWHTSSTRPRITIFAKHFHQLGKNN